MGRIVLIGMMGVGKSQVGAAIASRRGWDLVDTDREVEMRAGRTIEQIWRDDGEELFRELESQALESALAGEGTAVVAAGGGAVLREANRSLLLSHSPVVWLRATPKTLAARVGKGERRPLLHGDSATLLALLVGLSAERGPLYDTVADLVVDVDGLSQDQVVVAVEHALTAAASS
jgi:shikimate kinase